MTDRTELKKAIAVLEAQRAILGDAVVDTAIAPLRGQLAAQETIGELPAERRLITILFADVVGSTALAERLGAESSRLILDRCLQRASEAVDEFGGTVAGLMGDGLVAFFGAPQAHEDDPERAVLAAARVHKDIAGYAKDLGQPLQMRVGINTGRVVLGQMGGEVHSEYTAMGPPVNLAARLQSATRPGKTLLGETTARMIRYRFQVKLLEPLRLKGFEEPVNAYEMIGEHAQPAPARGIPGLQSPLVGRDDELEKLVEMAAGLEQGIGGIAALIGEPGIGKSRLLQELREAQQDGQYHFAEGRAYSYTQGQPFSVILDMLMELLELAADDSPAIMDLKLEAALAPLFEGELGAVWPFLSVLLGAPVPPNYADVVTGLDPEAMSARIIQAVQMLVERLAERRPLVLSFEDLHWADGGSLKLIETLMLATEHFPVLLILLFRPDLDKPVWQLKLTADMHFAHRYMELKLSPLDAAASELLIGNLLGMINFPGDLQETISERAQGNPLYVEELTRSLIESEFLVKVEDSWQIHGRPDELAVPQTLEKVIQARLDRLPPAERATLQTASVIGRRFAYRVLVDMGSTDGNLRNQLLRLQQLGMIRERSRRPELEYIFKHVIVQQVTYGTLLRERRRQLHLRAAETLERLFPERREELAGTLADHYAAAGEDQKAIPLFLKAAQRADEVYAYEEALHLLHRAQTLGEADNMGLEEQEELVEWLADIHYLLGESLQAYHHYQQALELSRHLGDSGNWIAVRLRRKICEAWWSLPGDDERRLETQALAMLEAGLRFAGNEEPHPETVRLLVIASTYVRAVTNDSRRQLATGWQTADFYARAAVEMAERLDAPVELSAALDALGILLKERGRIRDYVQLEQRRYELSGDPRFNDKREELNILLENAVALKLVGEHAQAVPLLLEAELLAEKVRAVSAQRKAMWLQSECWTRLDRWTEVLQTEERAMILQRNQPEERVEVFCWLLAFSASVYALRGEEETSARLSNESYILMRGLSGGNEENWGIASYY